MGQKVPYVSLVVTSRNDNHGGDLSLRMRVFMRGLIHQCDKHKLPAELVFVDWNPPSDKPLLKEFLPKPGADGYLSIKYVIVPEETHRKYAFSERLPLFQMIAKNVGIRRARAPFILCTNIDLLFSDELMSFLAKQQLKEGHYYRANRCDIPKNIDENKSIEELLVWSKNNIQKRLGKSGIYPNFSDTSSVLFKHKFFTPIFIALSRFKKLITSTVREKVNAMDTDACGDFTLMHKNDWLKIQGYPELEVYSLHIDSMGLFAANALDIKQEILPKDHCTYHISHDNGWEFKDEKDKVLFYTNKPVLDWWAVYLLGLKILKEKKTFDFNDEHWGLVNIELKEI